MNKIGDLGAMNGTYEDFIIVERFSEIDYVLLKRNSKYEPWIAAWAYNEERQCWGQGHYFENFIDAVRYIDSKLREISYDRMSEIASRTIDYIKDTDDIDEISDIYDIDFTEKEKEYFGIMDFEFAEEEDAYAE